MGSDSVLHTDYHHVQISIHAPRVGSDLFSRLDNTGASYFNPRSPCGERLIKLRQQIQISLFQSTLPVWGATGCFGQLLVESNISIHAPRVGSDSPPEISEKVRFYFNPRSPCGERLAVTPILQSRLRFQSTLPVWGATAPMLLLLITQKISIHAPRVGSDLNAGAL